MKKIVLSLVIVLAFILAGCGGGIPDGMDQQTYELGKKAVKVMEEYRDNKMDPEEANQRLDEISDELKALKFKDDDAEIANGSVQADVLAATVQTMEEKSVIDELGSLKKTLGIE